MRLTQVGTSPDGLPEWRVRASNFLVFHTILRYSVDFSEALRWARLLTDDISEAVKPYLVLHPLHLQYMHMT